MNLTPTPEQIEAARRQMEADRALCGITSPIVVGPALVARELIEEEVRAIPVKRGPAWVILCPQPGCTHKASGRTEARAVHYLSAHLVGAHDWRKR